MASVIECPSCGSNYCQSYSVLYQQGTSVISGKTGSTGIGVGIGGVGIGTSRGNFSGVQQTAAGAMASPPARKSLKWPIILTIIGLFLYVIPGLAAAFWAYMSWKYNHTTWVQLYNEWQNTFYCNQCGSSFVYSTTPNMINVTPENETLNENSAHVDLLSTNDDATDGRESEKPRVPDLMG